MNMKTLAALTIGMLGAGSALAVPTLQLDIDGGTYVGGSEESTVTTSQTFDLWALGRTAADGNGNPAVSTDNFYYLSIALLPKEPYSSADPANLGGVTVNNTSLSNLFGLPLFGNPPLESVDKQDKHLAPHGVFDTYYYQLAFKFDPNSQTTLYNVEDGTEKQGESLYKTVFSIDASGLSSGYGLHFDLFTFEDDDKVTISQFAPFSHDAAYCTSLDCDPVEVAEPSTIALFGIGLMSLVAIRRRSSSK